MRNTTLHGTLVWLACNGTTLPIGLAEATERFLTPLGYARYITRRYHAWQKQRFVSAVYPV